MTLHSRPGKFDEIPKGEFVIQYVSGRYGLFVKHNGIILKAPLLSTSERYSNGKEILNLPTALADVPQDKHVITFSSSLGAWVNEPVSVNNTNWVGVALEDANIASAATWNAKLDKSGTIANNDFAKFDSNGDLVGRSYSETRSDLGISDNEIIDWTADQGSTNIHSGNYTNTTYSEATSSSEGLMSTAHHDKLDGIASGATANTGTVTSVSVSDGSSSTAITTSGTFTFASNTGLDHDESGGTVTYSLDLPELTDGTADINGALDELIYIDQAGDGTKTQKRKQFDEIDLSAFNNDICEANATADQTQADINGLAITTTGALNSGSITSGFGTIDNGSSAITTTGTLTGGNGVCGGPSIWTFATSGYFRSADSINYYMSSYKGDETWLNTLTANPGMGGGYLYSDVPAVEWIAHADGKVTNIRMVVRCTAVSDAMKVTVFKGTLSDDSGSIALTALGNATNAMGATNKYYYTTQNLSVSNAFSAGDGLFVGIAKTADTGTSTYNFSVTVTGEFT